MTNFFGLNLYMYRNQQNSHLITRNSSAIQIMTISKYF